MAKDLMQQVKNPGFGMIQAKIAQQPGMSMQGAGAALATTTRKASKKAKKKNPKLNKVKGAVKKKMPWDKSDPANQGKNC